jgi:predicted dithiol-disulfide oxidoreductase (DUF899 family)
MAYAQSQQQINDFRRQITELRSKMRALQATADSENVTDYAFQDASGPVQLSELFGEHEHLFVIHNMGRACVYCTLWADGLNGVLPHLENRAAVVLTSPDAPDVQQAFAAERGWNFRMLSHAGSSFAEDMGFVSEHGLEPGVSVFQRDGEKILRVSDTAFGPGDDFCAVWHLMDLIPAGADGWQPRYSYS